MGWRALGGKREEEGRGGDVPTPLKGFVCPKPRPIFKGKEFKDRAGIVGRLSARGTGGQTHKRKIYFAMNIIVYLPNF